MSTGARNSQPAAALPSPRPTNTCVTRSSCRTTKTGAKPNTTQPSANQLKPMRSQIPASCGCSRGEAREQPHDAGIWERIGLSWLALGCVVLGLAPVFVVRQLDLVTQVLVGRGLGNAAAGWLFLAPVDIERASYSPVYFLLAVLGVMLVTAVVVHYFYHGRLRRGPAWDCGFPAQTSRMQDTAEGFGQPIRRIFEPFFRIESELPSPFDTHPRYHGRSDDRLWFALYLPCLLYTSDAADDLTRVDLGGRRIIKKKKNT